MVFEPSITPRVFGVPPGADFPQALYDNLVARTRHLPPEALARVQVLVATRRMQRRLIELFQNGEASLLPRIGVVTDVSHLVTGADLPTAVSTLRRSLDLKEVVAKLVAVNDTLASSSVVDLTDSLAGLLDEMQSEGVPLDALESVNTSVISGHWDQSLQFLRTIRTYVNSLSEGVADKEARHRAAVTLLAAQWTAEPPETPIIVAGSTGSRDTTRLLMRAVAGLPQGALVLPGFDFNLPGPLWDSLAENRDSEDHPQFRFARLMSQLGIGPASVKAWGDAPDKQRNTLVSLALRPASVTDQWLSEGPLLGNLEAATSELTLIETAQPRDEALAIAIALREAIERGKSAALIAPDATLARRVAAVLGRWNVIPDDSGGTPLGLTSAGRFARHATGLVDSPVTPVNLIACLKHPLTQQGEGRGVFQLFVQSLEAFLRRKGIVEVTPAVLQQYEWKQSQENTAFSSRLSNWVSLAKSQPEPTLQGAVGHHLALVEGLSGDPEKLWSSPDGEAVRSVITNFEREQDFEGIVTFSEYSRLFEKALAAESHRDQHGVRSDVMIWGTLEARVQGADVVILGGLNEGVWPEQPAPDPWLNRQMRRDIGLLLPERQIGLAAHDFQQAVGAPEVVLSRAKRSEDSETVPSRWLNRLKNLLSGLPQIGGPAALNQMQQRGDRYVAAAAKLDRPSKTVEAERRPAPSPPTHMRPTEYSVTDVQRLIRDPYAIYARKILKLQPAEPLTPQPDARLKGNVLHEILEQFFATDAAFGDAEVSAERLKEIAGTVLNSSVPWPATRSLWWGQLASISDWLIASEVERRADTIQLAREVKGLYEVPETRFRIVGKADRIDRLPDGLVIYDYKSGKAPGKTVTTHFDRQLLIEAVMAEAGAFQDVPASRVAKVFHIDVGRTPEQVETELVGLNETVSVSSDLADLLCKFDQESEGYISRRAMEKLRYDGDYDHLARFGEWDASEETTTKPVS